MAEELIERKDSDSSPESNNNRAGESVGLNDNECRTLTKTSNNSKTVFLTKIFPKRPLSLPVTRVNDVNHNLTIYEDTGQARRDRKTFHQDVQEALNSLLWQPYEYQNKRTFSEGSSPASLSYTSCSSSLSSLDLEDNASSAEVNNPTGGGGENRSSRDPVAASVSGCAAQPAFSECRAAVGEATVRECDDLGDRCDMRLEVPGGEEDGVVGGGGQKRSVSVGNLSSANVVGLPVHQRHSSHVEATGCAVQHLRSASVPKQQKIGDAARPASSNVSNVNVNFYRAVPVNVVSAVPTIQCATSGNDVSNVQIMPLNGPAAPPATTQVSVHVPGTSTAQVQTAPPKRPARTFTSTEAQTDEISVCPPPAAEPKERRRRRRPPRTDPAPPPPSSQPPQHNDRLPDLLNSHLPPPYSPPQLIAPPPPPPPPPPNLAAMPGAAILTFPGPPHPPPTHHQVVAAGHQVPLVQAAAPMPVPVTAATGFRFPFPASGFRRGRYSDEPPKGCCGLLAWKPGSLRWFIVLIALVGVCCVLVGTALGAMRPAGRDHLTVSLLMIGVGIILVTVSGVAWRLTSHDSSTCRTLWGLGGSTESMDACGAALPASATGGGGLVGGARRFGPRLPPSYGRPHHPYAAMLYPEFQYRPPPPSYQASMQEYRLRLLLLDRGGGGGGGGGGAPQMRAAAAQGAGQREAVSPPPTYRSHAGSLLRAPLSSRRDASQSEYSCPPSYRSQTSSSRPPTLHCTTAPHSREHSISLSDSNPADSVVNVVSIFNGADDDIALDNLTIDSLKMEPELPASDVKMSLVGGASDLGGKEGNLVTIVQTSDRSPVIVTVSGSSHADSRNGGEMQTEMEILAHL